MIRDLSWKLDPGDRNYASCQPQELGNGIIIGSLLPNIAYLADNIKFQSYCDGQLPVYNAARMTDFSYPYLDIVKEDWQAYIEADDILTGSFSYGIYPVLLSLTANFVITVFLTLLIFINIKSKHSKYTSILLKVGAVISSIKIIIFVTRALKELCRLHDDYGVATTYRIMLLFSSDLSFSILDLISIFLLQLCQVMIAIRLFSRNLEKRLVFLLGASLVIVANVLWAIPQFSDVINRDDPHAELLAPFVYLFRIAIAASYASTIISYGILKRRFCFATSQMAILTTLTVLVVLLQPALFLADVSNVWLSGVGELFNTTCYVGSTSIVWEWLDRLGVSERREQAQSILGRPIYEDEQSDYHIAKYALRVQKALTHAKSGNLEERKQISSLCEARSSSCTNFIDTEGEITFQNDEANYIGGQVDGESINQVKFKQQQSFKEVTQQKITVVCDRLLYYADQVVSKSWGTLSLSSKSTDDSTKREKMVRKRVGLDRPNEVYIYSTKDVIFEPDGDIEEEEEQKEANEQRYHSHDA
ncbi:hypothetical protein HG535_0F02320 [Zygotorulaspora mrakii]|uniref:pH-response regulator protein palH/RIM21 n=1 Tax=Zygotorulaspora mrakii TaxID=42260 RepID=A0A7H9B4V9_ZYGMR|nr:uncharacterized protein HG535_0F02320 [Zygotorulaspora mrakii]QLG73721.1 hypothetical protein HG535_0F02320 [Zygotorulaspora mrakii]